MARIARVVAVGYPHHVIQRGSRRQQVFFKDDDYRFYLSLLSKECEFAGTRCWAYCLMPNHVHLVLVPSTLDGLRGAIAKPHERFARKINERNDWRGHLWQARFNSFPMDEAHLVACVRYVELNPVRARLAAAADDWEWSSARAHLAGHDDSLVSVAPMLELFPDWRAYLADEDSADAHDSFRRHTKSGRPLGSKQFIARIESLTGRQLAPRR
ncbi:MAG: transposase [Gammaproteobacteria bacterium]|nr:transposase [Gammaproteobacteria bacterium]